MVVDLLYKHSNADYTRLQHENGSAASDWSAANFQRAAAAPLFFNCCTRFCQLVAASSMSALCTTSSAIFHL